MAVFRFRLDKVLRYRRRLVELRSQEVAAAELEAADLRRRLEELGVQMTALSRSAQAADGFDVRARRELAVWLDRLEIRSRELADEIAAAEEEAARRRTALAEAWREREVLERLRQRRREEWRRDQDRRDRAELDEIGQQRAGRARQKRVGTAAQVASPQT